MARLCLMCPPRNRQPQSWQSLVKGGVTNCMKHDKLCLKFLSTQSTLLPQSLPQLLICSSFSCMLFSKISKGKKKGLERKVEKHRKECLHYWEPTGLWIVRTFNLDTGWHFKSTRSQKQSKIFKEVFQGHRAIKWQTVDFGSDKITGRTQLHPK